MIAHTFRASWRLFSDVSENLFRTIFLKKIFYDANDNAYESFELLNSVWVRIKFFLELNFNEYTKSTFRWTTTCERSQLWIGESRPARRVGRDGWWIETKGKFSPIIFYLNFDFIVYTFVVGCRRRRHLGAHHLRRWCICGAHHRRTQILS